MLECGKNFKWTMEDNCPECKVSDNEDHRLNRCKMWNRRTNTNTSDEVNFHNIYSNDTETLKKITGEIENVWEIRYGNGRMKRV